MTVAFDTLKLAQRLEAAGMPAGQAQGVASALAETMSAGLVTREYLDLRLGETEARLRAEIAATKADILKWVIGAIGLQTLVILGAVAAFVRLLH